MGRHRSDVSDTLPPPGGHRGPGRRRSAARTGLLSASAAVAVGAAAVAGGLLPSPAGSAGGTRTDDASGLTRPDGPPSSPAADGGADTLTGTAGPGRSAAASPAASPTRTTARPTAPVATRTAAPTARAVPTARTGGLTGAAADVLTLVDQQRSAAGCGPLSPDPKLTELAQDFSDEMAARGFFDHTDPDGRTPWDRAAALGVTDLGGENIAEGQPDARAVMDAWMNSPGHRANILDCAYHTIGIGVHDRTGSQTGGPWWTQDFGF